MSYNWENIFNNQNIVDPNPPKGPVLDGPEPPDPMEEWLRRMGIPTIVYANDISATQQKKTKKQYPALTSLFGAKPIFNLGAMSAAEDDEDGGDGGDDPDPGDPDPEPYPIEIHYPDPGDPDPYPDPEPYPDPDPDPNPYPGQGQSRYPDPFSAVINTVLGLVFVSAQQAAYYKSNDQTHSSDYKNSINQMHTSIAALKETHQIQQKNLDNLLQKVASTGNQTEYSNLLNTYAQQREQAQSTQNLATRIQYAADNHDYQNVAAEIQNYTVPDQSATTPAPLLNDLDQNDWRYEHNSQLQAGLEKTFGDSSNTPVQYYYPQNQNYNSAPVQNYASYQQAPEHNFGTSDFPVFHLGVDTGNVTVPIETTSSVPSVPSPETIAETGEVMSASATVTDFMDNLNKIPEIDSNIIKQAFATYQGPTGQKIQADLEKTLQAGIEKIAQECVDGAKAFKLATEVSSKVSSIFAAAYIVQQFIQGFQKGGLSDGAIRGGVALAESAIATAIFGILLAADLPILAPASITLLASLLIDYAFEQLLDYLKL